MQNARPRRRASESRTGASIFTVLGTAVTTTVALTRAAMRVTRFEHDREADLDELVGRLRRVPSARVDPQLAPRVLERLLSFLPPYRIGRCMKRSFFLLDLWSRAGLETELHLGYRPVAGGGLEGHAWVTTNDARFACARPEDVVEAYRL